MKCLIATLSLIGAIAAGSAAADPSSPVGTWVKPALHHEQFQIVFSDDGSLQFEDGLLFYNPSSWSLTEAGLEIELGGSHPFPIGPSEDQLKGLGNLVAFDPEARTLLFRFHRCTRFLTIAGWRFFREVECTYRAPPGRESLPRIGGPAR